MQERLAKLISVLTSPFLVLAVFGIWTIGLLTVSATEFFRWAVPFFVFIVGIPLVAVLRGIKLGTIADLHIALREERTPPFIIAILSAVSLTAIYILLDAPHYLIALAVAVTVSGIVFGIITTFWKISIHAAAYTGSVLLTAQLVDLRYLYFLLFLPFVIWARYIRKRHSILQSLVATVVVGLCVLATLSLF